ncbi:MAG: hypothetical protein HC844_10005, partial [Tabrizicola sp.]|nr:hypothetical protein [Tabrizicola sp.]
MQEPVEPFDLKALFNAVDDARVERGLSWKSLSIEVRVAASTIRRFEEASDAEADGVRWLGLAPEVFIHGSRVDGEPLRTTTGGMVRVGIVAVNDVDDAGRSDRRG